jgi:predicted Rossmann fold flavoprotein
MGVFVHGRLFRSSRTLYADVMAVSQDAPDVIVVGAGAAGLYAAIHAGRSGARVLVLDGARTIGAKILVAGGGRCNVTHHAVDEKAYAGASSNAIRKVLRRHGVDETVAFFEAQGVTLKREDTGKLFPTTDRARSVLDALLRAASDAGVEIRFPRRVLEVARVGDGFEVSGEWGAERAPHLVLATGGKALPRSGSDGLGYEFARRFGHTITDHVRPALVPLILPGGHPLRELSGIAVPATLTLRGGTGKNLKAFTNSLLCTHFGLSGPCALDMSRYWRASLIEDPDTALQVNFLPGETESGLDTRLLANPSRTPLSLLRDELPERFVRSICDLAGIDPQGKLGQLTRDRRRALVRACVALDLPIEGDRGFTHAEVTMGGVPLREVRLETMESRACPGLHLIGELLDVDGRIGGFNFQWAWSSGYIAGTAMTPA